MHAAELSRRWPTIGTRIANALARRLVIPPHRDGGQAQYIERPLPVAAPSLGPCLDWAREHLELPLTVDDLARQALMSPRTFARRFREMTGTAPLQWLCAERVRRAQPESKPSKSRIVIPSRGIHLRGPRPGCD